MKPLIIANWKMNPAIKEEARALFDLIKQSAGNLEGAEVVICPPSVYLSDLSGLELGAQNCFWEAKGPYTGELSPEILAGLGVSYIIVGHSERRKYLKESDEMANLKIKKVLAAKMIPILCIGETGEERKNSQTETILKKEIIGGLEGVSAEDAKKIVVAYEPVWAISKGDPYQTKEIPTPENIKKEALYIQSVLAELYGKESAAKIRIIYGGSANAENARGFVKDAGMQGLLVGGASLAAEEFVKLVKSVQE